MGRSALTGKARKGVKERLQRWYLRSGRCESETALAQHLGVPRSTVAGWFEKRAKTPDGNNLLRMASADDLSPSWVLTGLGPERLETSTHVTDIAEELRAFLALELERGGTAGSEAIREFLPPPDRLLPELVNFYRTAFFYWHIRDTADFIGALRQSRTAILDRVASATLGVRRAPAAPPWEAAGFASEDDYLRAIDRVESQLNARESWDTTVAPAAEGSSVPSPPRDSGPAGAQPVG